MARAPERIGKYAVVRRIGQGGMAVVYEAVDPDLGRRVALKVLVPGERGTLIARLHREAAVVARLRHPNIVPVHEVGIASDDGSQTHFIAMDFIAGTTLAEAAAKITLEDRVRAVEQIAHAVHYAHTQGVIHRDVKPQNVLVEPSTAADGLRWRVFLTDFGLAKFLDGEHLTRTGTALGTPCYMAPEQVVGASRRVRETTDVWALGAMLYEMVNGRPPFRGATPAEVFQQVLTSDPATCIPGAPGDLQTVWLKAMEKEPPRRFVSAEEFAQELGRWLAGEPIRSKAISTLGRFARSLRSHRALAASVAGLALVSAVATAIILHLQRRAEEARRAQDVLARQKAQEERESRRQRALQWLTAQWALIADRKRELRHELVAFDRAREQLQEAVAQLGPHVDAWPDEPQGRYVRARGRLYLWDRDGAERDVRAALALRPDFGPGWTLLGVVRIEQYREDRYGLDSQPTGHLASVEPILEEALAAFDKGPPRGEEQFEATRWSLAWTREDDVLRTLARAYGLYYRDRKRAEAIGLLETMLGEYRAEEYLNELAVWNTDVSVRVRLHTEALTLAPGYDAAWFDRGVAKGIILRDLRGAVADFDRALTINPSHARALVNRGTARFNLKEYEAARDDFDQSLKFRPDQPMALLNRGNAKRLLGDADGALRDYDRAIELASGYALVHYMRATLRRDLGRTDDAVADLRRALELAPKDWPHRRSVEEALRALER